MIISQLELGPPVYWLAIYTMYFNKLKMNFLRFSNFLSRKHESKKAWLAQMPKVNILQTAKKRVSPNVCQSSITRDDNQSFCNQTFRTQIQTIRIPFVLVRVQPAGRFVPVPTLSDDQNAGDFTKYFTMRVCIRYMYNSTNRKCYK